MAMILAVALGVFTLGFLLGRAERCIPGHLRHCGPVGTLAVQECHPHGWNYGPCREVGD